MFRAQADPLLSLRKKCFWDVRHSSLFVGCFLFLDRHVLQFTGLENVSAFLAFHIFGVFVAGDDLHPRMLALFGTDFLLGRWRGLAKRHKRVDCLTLERNVRFC